MDKCNGLFYGQSNKIWLGLVWQILEVFIINRMEPKEEANYKLIAKAIEQKNTICFTYDSHKGKTVKKKACNVEPYLISKHKSTQNIMLSGYFLPTTEQLWERELPEWKFYLLKHISDIVILNIPFIKPRTKYNPKPFMMDVILAIQL